MNTQSQFSKGYQEGMADIAAILNDAVGNSLDDSSTLGRVVGWVISNTQDAGKLGRAADWVSIPQPDGEHVCTTKCMIGGHLDTVPQSAQSVRQCCEFQGTEECCNNYMP